MKKYDFFSGNYIIKPNINENKDYIIINEIVKDMFKEKYNMFEIKS